MLLHRLVRKTRRIQDKELLAAFHKSGLSHQDVIDLMARKRSDDDEESDES